GAGEREHDVARLLVGSRAVEDDVFEKPCRIGVGTGPALLLLLLVLAVGFRRAGREGSGRGACIRPGGEGFEYGIREAGEGLGGIDVGLDPSGDRLRAEFAEAAVEQRAEGAEAGVAAVAQR